jgi:DNA-binding MarR family transcriptional regulator
MTSRWLDEEENRAWRGYRRLFTLLEGRLARDLAADSGLSMADYAVLSNLVEAEGRSFRLTELADHMQWSQSRLSHHVRRMEDRGLVERRDVAGDGRGTKLLLTGEGLRAIALAAPGHMRSVREHMIDRLDRDQLRALADIADRIVGHLAAAEGEARKPEDAGD